MKGILTVFAALTILCVSCSKDNTTGNNNGNNNNSNNQNTATSLKWTYLGTSFNGSNITTSKPDTIPNTNTYWPYYEFQGTDNSTAVHLFLRSIAVGTYTDQDNDRFLFGNYDVDAYTVSVTSNTNNKISGTFTGTYQGNSITGSFSNIAFN